MKEAFRIAKAENAQDLPLPQYMTKEAAGMDLRANITGSVIIKPGEFIAIPVGIIIALPSGYEGQVRPRSGLAYKYGVTTLNSPGTVDADYRGELKVLLINHGKENFIVNHGDRIAQLVVGKIERVQWTLCQNLDARETERGDGGYGHTGMF